MKTLLLNSNNFSGRLNPLIATLSNLESISLFDNNLIGEVPFELEKLKNLKEMNISFNKFSGLVSKDLVRLDAMNMKMLNEKGIAVLLNVAMDKNSAIVSED